MSVLSDLTFGGLDRLFLGLGSCSSLLVHLPEVSPRILSVSAFGKLLDSLFLRVVSLTPRVHQIRAVFIFFAFLKSKCWRQ